jgi:hypothetical protein
VVSANPRSGWTLPVLGGRAVGRSTGRSVTFLTRREGDLCSGLGVDTGVEAEGDKRIRFESPAVLPRREAVEVWELRSWVGLRCFDGVDAWRVGDDFLAELIGALDVARLTFDRELDRDSRRFERTARSNSLGGVL